MLCSCPIWQQLASNGYMSFSTTCFQVSSGQPLGLPQTTWKKKKVSRHVPHLHCCTRWHWLPGSSLGSRETFPGRTFPTSDRFGFQRGWGVESRDRSTLNHPMFPPSNTHKCMQTIMDVPDSNFLKSCRNQRVQVSRPPPGRSQGAS